MQASFQNKNFKFSEFKKLNKKSFSQVKKFYKKLILNYINLDRKFKFSEELDKKYIFEQIENIYKKKKWKIKLYSHRHKRQYKYFKFEHKIWS